MSGSFVLDWAVLAVSLFNTILLLWLGLTVLLNAERRSWGLWLAGGGLLGGAAFFVSHTAILGHELAALDLATDLWWRMGWGVLVGLPFAWYVLMLWYGGYWDAGAARRRRPIVISTGVLAGVLLLLTTLALPSYDVAVQRSIAGALGSPALPWSVALYPVYSVLCIGLSLWTLSRPHPSPRAMGEIARRRARPWLMTASVALLSVSLLVTLAVGWLGTAGGRRLVAREFGEIVAAVAGFDLVIAALVGVAVLCLGQAIVAYEIFTGQALPRRGFWRHWRRVIILAGGYSVVIGWSLARGLPTVYALLLTALVMTAFYALLVWRSFGDRERAIARLRPFVGSEGAYQRLVGTGASSDVDVVEAFRALCREVLDARSARLIPLGRAATLAGTPLCYPGDGVSEPLLVQSLAERFRSDPALYVGVDPAFHDGAVWAVPLRREQGLIGVLLLGPRSDEGLYVQEEIELAQAVGERLIDLVSSAEMGRRLMALQRQRLAETQIADQRVRRVLHDEVLPKLHAAMLELSTEAAASPGGADAGAVNLLADAHHQIADLLRDLPASQKPSAASGGVIGALKRVVRGELSGAFDAVRWEITPGAEAWLAELLQTTTDVLFFAAREAVRNAARYGRDTTASRPFALTVSADAGDALVLQVADDGVGIRPGEGTAEGAGQGLALHTTMMAVIGGSLEVESAPGYGTRVTLTLPGPDPLLGTRTSPL